jgi:hypothetical protein
MREERTNCLKPSGYDEWWMSGWTRLYDKIKATDGFYTNGELMNKRAYAFIRMAQIVVNQNTKR